jgi:hypothetical protein
VHLIYFSYNSLLQKRFWVRTHKKESPGGGLNRHSLSAPLELARTMARYGGSNNDATLCWPYGFGFGNANAIAGPIWTDLFSPEHTSPSVISVAALSFRLVPGVIAAIHRSGAGFPETGDETLRVCFWHLADILGTKTYVCFRG